MLKYEMENRWETKLFLAFILTHIIAWTLVPTLTRLNLPLDSIEGTIWGNHLEWGYDKNPFLTAWLSALAIFLDRNGTLIYLLSQLSVGICFICVWLLAKKMLPPLYALISLLILEGIQYFNFHAVDFSDNTLELAGFALTILFFYEALTTKKLRDWLLTGFFAGVSMMTKYYSALLLGSMFFFLLYNANARQFFKKRDLYAGFIVFLIVITPHFFWLINHHFVTVHYAFHRITIKNSYLSQHFLFPLKFLSEQCEALLPACLLLLALLIPFAKGDRRAMQGRGILTASKNLLDAWGRRPSFSKRVNNYKKPKIILSTFDKEFLLFITVGPLLLTLLISFIFGIPLRAAWGQPLLSFWGILLVVLVQPRLSQKKVFLFFLCLLTLQALSLVFYYHMESHPKKPNSANFPGKIIADRLTHFWHEKYHSKLSYVAGERWLSGNISFYSIDRPSVFMDWDNLKSPWIVDAELKEKGAIFVWNLSEFYHRPSLSYAEIKMRYPDLSNPEIHHFMWYRNKKFPVFSMMVAYLPQSYNAHPNNMQPNIKNNIK